METYLTDVISSLKKTSLSGNAAVHPTPLDHRLTFHVAFALGFHLDHTAMVANSYNC